MVLDKRSPLGRDPAEWSLAEIADHVRLERGTSAPPYCRAAYCPLEGGHEGEHGGLHYSIPIVTENLPWARCGCHDAEGRPDCPGDAVPPVG